MFFIIGISTGEKKLDFVQTILCSRCGSYGRYEVFLTYTYLSIFFIPIFKWNKQYVVKSSCCSSVYKIDSELGKRIATGECTNMIDSDLYLVHSANRCSNCGYQIDKSFNFCPECGHQIEE